MSEHEKAEPVGYVTKNELTQLRLGVSCVDLFGNVVPKGFEMVPLYEQPTCNRPQTTDPRWMSINQINEAIADMEKELRRRGGTRAIEPVVNPLPVSERLTAEEALQRIADQSFKAMVLTPGWSKEFAAAHLSAIRAAPPAPAEAKVDAVRNDDDVVNAPPPRFSPERPYGVQIFDDPLPVLVSPPNPSSNALEIEWKAEAFDMIVAARKKHIDAVAAYNARRELASAERRRGNWTIKLDAEYHAMNDAQVEFYSTVQDACSAALSHKEGEKK